VLWQAIALWLAATHSTVLESGGDEDKEKVELAIVDVFDHIVDVISRAFCLHPGFSCEDGTGWGGTEQHRRPDTRSVIAKRLFDTVGSTFPVNWVCWYAWGSTGEEDGKACWYPPIVPPLPIRQIPESRLSTESFLVASSLAAREARALGEGLEDR